MTRACHRLLQAWRARGRVSRGPQYALRRLLPRQSAPANFHAGSGAGRAGRPRPEAAHRPPRQPRISLSRCRGVCRGPWGQHRGRRQVPGCARPARCPGGVHGRGVPQPAPERHAPVRLRGRFAGAQQPRQGVHEPPGPARARPGPAAVRLQDRAQRPPGSLPQRGPDSADDLPNVHALRPRAQAHRPRPERARAHHARRRELERRQRTGHTPEPGLHRDLHQAGYAPPQRPQRHRLARRLQGSTGDVTIAASLRQGQQLHPIPDVRRSILRILRQRDDGSDPQELMEA